MRKLIACFFLCACASQGVPPGGPPDTQAPKILSITPDSGTTLVKGNSAVFKFDEVVSERPSGATTLGDVFIVSPRQGVPNVSWHREEVRVKPRKGWLPNTTYTVTMLPGMADLRGNVRNTGASTFFSTGSAIDRGTIAGMVYDLISGSAASGAVVEARLPTDSTVSWLTRTDSTGAFRLAHLPRKPFSLRAYIDKNKNFGLDPDEPSDTSSLVLTDSGSADFFVAVRDTIPPKISAAKAVDSVTISVTFDRASDSASALTPAAYSVVGQDSSKIQVASVAPPKRDTSHKQIILKRPMPVLTVTLTLARPMDAKISYRLHATGIRGLLGATQPSDIPVAKAPVAPATPPGKRPPPPPNLPTNGAVPLPIKHD